MWESGSLLVPVSLAHKQPLFTRNMSHTLFIHMFISLFPHIWLEKMFESLEETFECEQRAAARSHLTMLHKKFTEIKKNRKIWFLLLEISYNTFNHKYFEFQHEQNNSQFY